MPSFSCDKCGYSWSDGHNFSSCPNCLGLGRVPTCTCKKLRSAFGQIIAIVSNDLNCPIHGGDRPTKEPA